MKTAAVAFPRTRLCSSDPRLAADGGYPLRCPLELPQLPPHPHLRHGDRPPASPRHSTRARARAGRLRSLSCLCKLAARREAFVLDLQFPGRNPVNSIPLRRLALALAALRLATTTAHAQLFRAYDLIDRKRRQSLHSPAAVPVAARCACRCGRRWGNLERGTPGTQDGPVTIAKSVTILAAPGARPRQRRGRRRQRDRHQRRGCPGGASQSGHRAAAGCGRRPRDRHDERREPHDPGLPHRPHGERRRARERHRSAAGFGNDHPPEFPERPADRERRESHARAFVDPVERIHGRLGDRHGPGTTTQLDIADSTITETGLGGVRSESQNATASVRVAVRASNLAQNYPQGAAAVSSAGGAAELAIGDSLVSGNIEGVIATGAGARAWVSGNIVSGNGTGFWNYGSGAVFESAGNNAMRHNATDLIGTIGAVVTK